VGIRGAYVQACSARTCCFVAGAVAAVLVTLVTFLPSFIFILAGRPSSNSTHRQPCASRRRFNAITAGVGGVMPQPGPCFFAYHVAVAEGLAAGFDWNRQLIALGAAAQHCVPNKRSVIQVHRYCAMWIDLKTVTL